MLSRLTASRKMRGIIVVGPLLVVILASGGVFLWQKLTPASSGRPGVSQPAPVKVARDVEILHWGVRFQPRAGLEGLVVTQLSPTATGFSTYQLQSLSEACHVSQAPLGILNRFDTPQVGTDGAARPPLTYVSGHYYYLTGSQANCLQESRAAASDIELLEKQSLLLSQSLQQLELSQ